MIATAGELFDQPKRVASAPSPERKLASAGAASIVSVLAKRLGRTDLEGGLNSC
jgi:hypothetical protein